MKRVFSLLMAVVMVAVLLPLGTVANAAEQEITLSAGGSLADALKNVADGGTIRVEGTVAVTAAPGTHNKTVTITGDTLDFTSLGNVTFGDNITFKNIALTFKTDALVFAGGYNMTFGEGLTMANPIKLFGGKNGAAVASTDLTVLSGTYTSIYGGSHKGVVTGNTNLTVGGGTATKIYGGCYNGFVSGNTNLTVGGSTNAAIDWTDHTHEYCIYGGSWFADDFAGTRSIGGTAKTVFTGSAKANYIYGGHRGSGAIDGGTDLTVSGGSVMGVYGGSPSSYTGNVKLLISGGTMDQVFGGCEGDNVTGNVALDITGGTIRRRVYGGCYNEVSLFGSWDSSYYVNGTITVTLHSGANIDYSSGIDQAFYARSRYKTANSAEKACLVYADEGAQSINLKKSSYMSGVTTADNTHYHTYSASDNVITQNCIDSKCSASATLVVTGACYNGSAVKTGSVAYSGNWWGGDLAITYANNVNPGTATASISCGGATVSQDFTITREKELYIDGIGYETLEDAVAAARKTPGADTIELWGNVEVASHMVFNTEVTLMANEEVTITATDDQTGSIFRVIGGGKLTIQGASEATPITLVAGKNTTNLLVTNGGEAVLTNVRMVGSDNTIHTSNNKARGIFNDGGIITVKSAEIANMKGDGIYILNDGEVNLEDVTIANTGRYGIKVKGKLNITKGLTIKASGNNAIDIENGGVANGSVAVNFENNLKDIHVRVGGAANLPYDEA